jgi:hypothetical protein
MGFQVVKAVEVSTARNCTAAVFFGVLSVAATAAHAGAPLWDVTSVSGGSLGCARDSAAERLAIYACTGRCAPIPWQLDERDSRGDPIFDGGDLASVDDPPGVVDTNDEIVFMTSDAGRPSRHDELPPADCRLAIHVRRSSGFDGWAYAVVLDDAAPRAAKRYVTYDRDHDMLAGERVTLGFRARLPQYLAVTSPRAAVAVNLLDRFKVRASAWFLGVIPVGRNEDDLDPPAVGWHAGPIRIVRRQTQRIRIGWGIKSPRFIIDTHFYRNWVAMPVAFRLNFPPTFFFSSIAVEAGLDFRDLRGWRVVAPEISPPVQIGAVPTPMVAALNRVPAAWFAVVGPHVQFVQLFAVSASLASLERTLVYRETARPRPPEVHGGELPGIGYVLRGWGGVGSGAHAFTATTYALPSDENLAAFLAERAVPPTVDVAPLPPAPPR